MSTTTIDPIDRLLDAAQNGKTLIKNRDVLHFTFMPNQILHRDPEQEKITQSLLPILMESRPSNLLVYGKPGTGKTLVIKKVLSKIQKRVEEGSFPIKLAYTNAKQEPTLYGLLVSFGRQLGLGSQKHNDEQMWIPSKGLSISEGLHRILYVIENTDTKAVFVHDEIE